jgi:hypothetical protein
MSQTWMEDLESEDYESNGEADYEAAGDDARSDARRARQQRIMLERRRMMLERQQREAGLQRKSGLPRRPMPPPGAARATGPSPSHTIRAIRDLDLDTKVELDSIRRRLEESNRRASRGTWAAVAGIATAEIINQFDALDKHPNVSAAILAAPLLLLSPDKQKSGIEGWLLDPRVIGGAAVVGIVVASRFTSTSNAVNKIQIFPAPPPALTKAAGTGSLTALATDRSGNPLSGTQFTWTSSPAGQLTITVGPDSSVANYSLIAGATATSVIITAQADGKHNFVVVPVNLV